MTCKDCVHYEKCCADDVDLEVQALNAKEGKRCSLFKGKYLQYEPDKSDIAYTLNMPKPERIMVNGHDLRNMMECDVSGITVAMVNSNNIINEAAKNIAKATDEYIIERCLAVDVDPDALKKQLVLIQQLRDTIDILGKYYVGCKFTEYFELQDENARLRKELYGDEDD